MIRQWSNWIFFGLNPENTTGHLVDGRYWCGAPDLVIKVISPSTGRNDRDVKYRLYERYGVRAYWMVEPEAAFLEVYRLENSVFVRAAKAKR